LSQAYASLILFQALNLVQNTPADAVRKIETGPNISLDYCIAKQWAKRRTDVSGAQTEEEVGPDTGPSGGFVEIKITIDRSQADQQDTLNTLLQWYRLLNTALPFRRGFLGLENTDNPSLNLNPTTTLGYKLISFQMINPVDNKGKQEYIITIQFLGNTNDLPVFP
jgi:hypothetical protein